MLEAQLLEIQGSGQLYFENEEAAAAVEAALSFLQTAIQHSEASLAKAAAEAQAASDERLAAEKEASKALEDAVSMQASEQRDALLALKGRLKQIVSDSGSSTGTISNSIMATELQMTLNVITPALLDIHTELHAEVQTTINALRSQAESQFNDEAQRQLTINGQKLGLRTLLSQALAPVVSPHEASC